MSRENAHHPDLELKRRTQILDGAERLRRELGWRAVTIDQVARYAGLSRTAVYLRFRNKADIHFALIERALCLVCRCLLQAAAEPQQGLEKVLAMSRAFARFAVEDRHHFDSCSEFMSLHTPGMEPSPNEAACHFVLAQIHACFANAIALGHRDGTVHTALGTPGEISISLWALLQGGMQLTIVRSAAPDVVRARQREWSEHLLRFLRHMLQGSSMVS
ncbi:MAG TPA: TetR/AcrR family transcriptional regulator [Steroidobacteraceae bacterium]|nr:TetR/AcrR family transcriptional regulator [Steroidobacteraceae bacterium]